MSSRIPARRVAPSAGAVLTHRNLPLLLLQAREAVMARFRPILNAHGITEQQWRVVRALLEAEALEPREICRACCLSSPSLPGILARMEALGLVSRERWPQDQRRVQVRLTAAGRRLAARMAPRIEAAYREVESRIGPDQAQAVYVTLDRLLELLGLPEAADG